jgi:transposase InsO family protein
MVAKKFREKRVKVSFVLNEVGLSKSSFYYKKRREKRGRKPPGYSLKVDGESISDEEIKLEIENLLFKDFLTYGYIKVTHYLRKKGYLVNKKKVYRLMREEKLLLKKRRVKTRGKRDFAKERKLKPERPYEFLEMDIKYFFIEGERRNAYLLTLLDVFSRKVLSYRLKKSMRKGDVLSLLKEALSLSFLQRKGEITIRSDNASQFLSQRVRRYLKEMGVYQEFSHPGYPEENAHIEAFHSILEREIEKRFEFDTFEELKEVISRYIRFYNGERIHSSIGYMSPEEFLKSFEEKEVGKEKEGGTVERFEFIGENLVQEIGG